MNRFLPLLLVLALSVVVALPVQAAQSQSGILVDGEALVFDVEPQVIDGVLMVPIRAVAEAMVGVVSWNEHTQTATIASGSRTVALTVGKSVALLDGREVMLSGKVAKVADRTFVPASFLLLFYGSRLDITHPAVRDARAVDLLLKSVEQAPTEYDLALNQQLHMSDGIVTVDIASLSQGQIRGEQMLMTTTMKSLMLPPGAGDVALAIRAGKQYIKSEGVWQEVPGAANVSDLNQQFSLTGNAQDAEVMSEVILEAHLGESRIVGNTVLQDVVVTYDMNRLFTLFGDLMPADAAGEFSFEHYTAMITIDMKTGAAVAQKMDVATLTTIEGRLMRLELKMELNVTPNQAPIVWPADLQ